MQHGELSEQPQSDAPRSLVDELRRRANENKNSDGTLNNDGYGYAHASQIAEPYEQTWQAQRDDLYRELAHLVRLMEPLEQAGTLNVPGLATLNGARAALARARGEEANK